MARILVVDDEPGICRLLESEFAELGHESVSVGTVSDALKQSGSREFDVVFLDVRLPDGNGLEALPILREGPGNPEVIIMTGYGDPDGAELAVKNGAWDYLEKPPSMDQFNLALHRSLEYRHQKQNSQGLRVLERAGVIGESPRHNAVPELGRPSRVHRRQRADHRRDGHGQGAFRQGVARQQRQGQCGPFVVVDCASLPENLVESVLFGHEKGAFTGADKARPGLLQQADHGTLFLDEVGELPLFMQKKLLRALQEHSFRPVGGASEKHSDFRLLAATNRDLQYMVDEGQFRDDLLFRLKTFVIKLPPLRDRLDDIEDLAVHFINRLCNKYQIPLKGFSPDFFDLLRTYDWPGNVRELFNTLEMVLSRCIAEPVLFGQHLPVELRAKGIRSTIGQGGGGQTLVSTHAGHNAFDEVLERAGQLPNFKDFRDNCVDVLERQYLERLLLETGSDRNEAMRVSGLAKTRLYGLLKKHDLSFMK